MKGAIKHCREHDILKEFLEQHSTEVFNMLLTEWNTEDALAVRFEEGWEGGRGERDMEIARNALTKGLPLEIIQDITGLSADAIRNIQADL
jgi:hypothetical protein